MFILSANNYVFAAAGGQIILHFNSFPGPRHCVLSSGPANGENVGGSTLVCDFKHSPCFALILFDFLTCC